MEERFLGLSVPQWIAIFTGCLVFVTIVQAGIYWAIHTANKVVERAYVDMSPKVGWGQLKAGKTPQVMIAIKNHGRTPADVTAAALIIRTKYPPQ